MTDQRHATPLALAWRNEHVEVVRLLEMKEATKVAQVTTRLWAARIQPIMAFFKI
jgi:hypothetical protein